MTTATSPREWAHVLADRGLRVHPVWWVDAEYDEDLGRATPECACEEGLACSSAGKHPMVSTTYSSTDHAQIDKWWDLNPYANLGVNTQGITVVDVDPRHGGGETYPTIQPDLAPTFTVRTGGGGWQEYYSGEVEKSQGKLGRGIDFKSGPNQQVVGPGSVHASGVEYTVAADQALAPTPTRVRQLSVSRLNDGTTADGAGADLTAVVGAGERNDALVAAAAAYANTSTSLQELLGHLTVWNQMHCDPPGTDERVLEIATHRWAHHDGTYFDPAAAAPLFATLNDDGSYSFDAGDELAAIIDGTYVAPHATILQVEEGPHLFYAKAMNLVYGEDSIGKTWVALSAAREVLNGGGTVVHLDWDDSYATCANRLWLLGTDAEALRARYKHKTSPADIRPVASAILMEKADLIIVDVVANAIAAADLNEDKAGDYLKWAADTAISWARGGACVILNDHVTKSGTDGNRGNARGSGAKRGGVDGAAYEVSAIEMLLPGEGGTLMLTIGKDRHGSVGRRGEHVAHLVYGPALELQIVRPPMDAEDDADRMGALRMTAQRLPFTRSQMQRWFADGDTPMPRTNAQRLIDGWLRDGAIRCTMAARGPVGAQYEIVWEDIDMHPLAGGDD